MKHKLSSLLMLVTITLVLCGCASFAQDRLPRVESIPDVSQYKNKPSAYIEFNFYRGKADESPFEVPAVKDQMQPVVASAFEKTQLFSELTFDKAQAVNKDYLLKINIYNYGNNDLAAASGLLTGFTFGVIPGAATDNYTVVVEALDNQGNILSAHTNDDAVRTWIGLLFIPVSFNTPQKAISRTLENQVMTALIELFNRKVMKYSSVLPSTTYY